VSPKRFPTFVTFPRIRRDCRAGIRVAPLVLAMACGEAPRDHGGAVTATVGSSAEGSGGTGSGAGPGGSTGTSGTAGSAGTGGGPKFDTLLGDLGPGGGWEGDPITCAQAAENHTYVGCDFYPTVLPNVVKGYFDYAVVVANAGDAPADVVIERGGVQVGAATVAPGSLETLYLPWVDELKHYDYLCDTDPSMQPGPLASKRVVDGAYHLTSSVPVTVFQFNPLEFEGAGGPAGKDWSACQQCWPGCSSYTNDASLLLPSTALTGSYVVTAMAGGSDQGVAFPGYVAVTGLFDGTTVQVKVSPTGRVIAGGGIPEAGPGTLFSLPLDRGEVVVLMGDETSDLGGTIVSADAPVQVMTGMPHVQLPYDTPASDHLEETVFPVETLGTRYHVVRPTGPNGDLVPHRVRLFGVVDGTQLSYPQGAPPGAPVTLNLGEVADLGIVDQDFEVEGDQAFAVATFQLAGSLVTGMPLGSGDPAQSAVAAVEQYRSKYVFLAPSDYTTSFATVVRPEGLALLLDGAPVTQPPVPIGGGWEAVRIPLSPGPNDGAHVLRASEPFGLQVMGYGFATSYQYPGGLNLEGITNPLPPPEG